MENYPKQTLEESDKNEREQTSRVEQLAADFHTMWQQSRLNEDETHEPWVEEISKGSEIISVDIANTAFTDLPAELQKGYIEDAQAILDFNQAYKEEFGEDLDIHDRDLQGYARMDLGSGLAETWLRHEDWAQAKQEAESNPDTEA